MPRFNEPERYLLEQWTDARSLEDAMESVRSKYRGIFEEVIEELTKNHPQLDYYKAKFNLNYGGIGVGKSSWPKNPNGWPSGFYVEDVRIENLTSPDSEPPYKCVYIFHSNPNDVERGFSRAPEKVHGKELAKSWEALEVDKKGTGVWSRLGPREELFSLLLKDEARGFIECMVNHFESLVKFTPVVDDILANKRGRK